MIDTILGRIRNEKTDFITKTVEIAPGYTFSQHSTIERIEAYFNSRFLSGPNDPDGWTKPFYNIVRKPCAVASKEIDLDTKDIIIRAENRDYITAELMAAEFKQWMKDQGFAADLNEYADLCPEYGSVVIKKVKNRLHTVRLKGLVLSNPQAKSLDHTNIIEPHSYSREEFLTEAEKRGWDEAKVQEVLDIYDAAGKVDIEVDERYGWCSEAELKAGGDANKMVYTLCLAAGTDMLDKKEEDGKEAILTEKGVVLYHEPIKKHPYREWHWARVPGRWLGLGFVEMLFDPQVRINENAYHKAKALGWLSLHFFFTDDETITRNLFNDAKNGDVIRGQKEAKFQEIQMGERNLSYYNSEEQRWDKNAADLTFTPEIISGESLPSGTPARTGILLDQNVKKYFDRKREDFGIWVKSLIEDDIMPQFVAEKGKAHTFSFSGTGNDREALEKRVLDMRMVAIFQQYVDQNHKIPSASEWQRLKLIEQQKISASPTLDIDIDEGAYANLKYRLDVVITKENEDTDSKLAGLQNLFKLVMTNPAAAVSPVTRPLFLELAHFLGMKNVSLPTEIEMQSMAPPPNAAPAAPGASEPAPSGDILSQVPLPA